MTDSCCPQCGCRFSEWFVWDGVCYCYPCWRKSGVTEVIKEDDDGE